MNIDMIQEKMKAFLKSRNPDLDLARLKENIPLVTVFNWDSVEYVSFIIEVETLFGRQFISPDIYNMNNSFLDFIKIMEQEFI